MRGPSRPEQSELPVSCNRDCGAGCALLARVSGGRLLGLRDNPRRPPWASGCARGYQMRRVVYSPDRLLAPLIRDGARGTGSFREASWEEALDRVASGLGEVSARHGSESILALGGSGSCRGALHNTSVLTRRFLACLAGTLAGDGATYSVTTGNYSSQATSFVAPLLFGTQHAGMDAATIEHSRLILLWGANLCDTRFGNEWENRIRALRRAGVPVIVVDPRRSRTAERLASAWVPVLPGTDSALMAAVLHVLISRSLVDRKRLEETSVGFDELEAYVRGERDGVPKSPAWAQGVCGTPREQIESLAVLYGTTKPAALIPGLSVQRTLGGEEPCRFAVVLQAATGNAGIAGGSSGAHVSGRLPGPRCGSLSPVPPSAAAAPGCGPTSRRSPREPLGFPVYEWPDALLGGTAVGYPSDIRAVYNVGGNYLAQGADIRKSMGAFERLELAVCHDLFLTPTARWCDVVLPATTFLERNDIVFPDGNYLHYSHKVVDPAGLARNDYDIFRELSDRLGFGRRFSEGRSEEAWIERFLDQSEVVDREELRRTGIYAAREQGRIGLEEFFRDPAGHPLQTPSGRIEIASSRWERAGMGRSPECRVDSASSDFPLRLITPHSRHFVNSQNANIPWFADREEPGLLMHAEDARAAGVRDGDEVLLSSPQGAMRVLVRAAEAIARGVVCLPVGRWPRFDPDGLEGAGAANVLTSTTPTLPSHGARTHSCAVRVEPLGSLRH